MFDVTINGKEYSVDFEYRNAFNRRGVVCVLRNGEMPLVEGLSVCHDHDNFSKYYGRKIALSRMLKNAFDDKEARTKIWNKYFEKSPIRRTVVKHVKEFKKA